MRGFSAQHLLPGPGHHIQFCPGQIHRKGGACRITNRKPLTVRADEIGIGQAHAAGRAIPDKNHIALRVHRAKIGQLAIGRIKHARIGQLQLLQDIGRPILGEGFPHKHIHPARAEQGPERHFHRARVGGRHNAKPPIRRHAEDRFGKRNHLGQLRLGCGSAMAAPKQRAFKRGECPARTLGTGTG